ncbi:MAG: hypothetical protein D6741_03795, partial [Planctomycetota bacterium]
VRVPATDRRGIAATRRDELRHPTSWRYDLLIFEDETPWRHDGVVSIVKRPIPTVKQRAARPLRDASGLSGDFLRSREPSD